MNAMSTLIRHIAVYLLVLLLPLQAAAASSMSMCAEMMSINSRDSSTIKHCDHSGSVTASTVNHDADSKAGHAATCWLGSICMASVGFAALPAAHHFPHIDQTDSVSPFIAHAYTSFIPEGPQRPPAILRA
jgi:hypothetical protein